jgi:hypothetical protein
VKEDQILKSRFIQSLIIFISEEHLVMEKRSGMQLITGMDVEGHGASITTTGKFYNV